MLPTHRPPTHPGEMLLKEFLDPLGVSQVEAADRMSIPFQRLNSIVKGRRAVSADTALLLQALTGWDAQIWLTTDPPDLTREAAPAWFDVEGVLAMTIEPLDSVDESIRYAMPRSGFSNSATREQSVSRSHTTTVSSMEHDAS